MPRPDERGDDRSTAHGCRGPDRRMLEAERGRAGRRSSLTRRRSPGSPTATCPRIDRHTPGRRSGRGMRPPARPREAGEAAGSRFEDTLEELGTKLDRGAPARRGGRAHARRRALRRGGAACMGQLPRAAPEAGGGAAGRAGGGVSTSELRLRRNEVARRPGRCAAPRTASGASRNSSSKRWTSSTMRPDGVAPLEPADLPRSALGGSCLAAWQRDGRRPEMVG